MESKDTFSINFLFSIFFHCVFLVLYLLAFLHLRRKLSLLGTDFGTLLCCWPDLCYTQTALQELVVGHSAEDNKTINLGQNQAEPLAVLGFVKQSEWLLARFSCNAFKSQSEDFARSY